MSATAFLMLLSVTAIVASASCGDVTSCSQCAQIEGCGWCTQVDTCLDGDYFGAAQSTLCTLKLNTWYYVYCPESLCGAKLFCQDCVSAPLGDRCGWCGTTRTCEYGNDRQSLTAGSLCNVPSSDRTTVVAPRWLRNGSGSQFLPLEGMELQDACDVVNQYSATTGSAGPPELAYLALLVLAPIAVGLAFVSAKRYRRLRNQRRTDRVVIVENGASYRNTQDTDDGHHMEQSAPQALSLDATTTNRRQYNELDDSRAVSNAHDTDGNNAGRQRKALRHYSPIQQRDGLYRHDGAVSSSMDSAGHGSSAASRRESAGGGDGGSMVRIVAPISQWPNGATLPSPTTGMGNKQLPRLRGQVSPPTPHMFAPPPSDDGGHRR